MTILSATGMGLGVCGRRRVERRLLLEVPEALLGSGGRILDATDRRRGLVDRLARIRRAGWTAGTPWLTVSEFKTYGHSAR